jgi:hypothetical protein
MFQKARAYGIISLATRKCLIIKIWDVNNGDLALLCDDLYNGHHHSSCDSLPWMSNGVVEGCKLSKGKGLLV